MLRFARAVSNSGTPGYGTVFCAQHLEYSALFNCKHFSIVSAFRCSFGKTRLVLATMLSPMKYRYASTGWVGKPSPASAALVEFATSVRVSSSVPSRSNITALNFILRYLRKT